jgi:anti-sigma factor RsiW
MAEEISIHAWFGERIAAWLTDGLDAEERARFESHAGQCADCAAKLADAKRQDESLRGLFAGIGPAADFEDRVIRRLRTTSRRKFALPHTIRLHPMVKRVAVAAAAAVVLGGIGYGELMLMQGRHTDHVSAASEQWQIGQAVLFDGVRNVTHLAPSTPSSQTGRADLSYSYATPYPDASSLGSGFQMVKGLEPTFAVAADINPSHGKGGQNVLNSLVVGANPLPAQTNKFGHAAVPSAGQPSNYSYAPPVPAPPPVQGTYYKPESQVASGLRSQIVTRNPISDSKTTGQPVETGEAVANQPQPAPLPAPPPAVETPDSGRKVIRHGEMSFEVDSFDSAFMQITKIAAEEGGFVADTDSEKLANGKVAGTVTVRVPPDHLDTLTLKLRGLGDLKGQKIASDDITKEYTDLESELRAATAMENRLLEIIKTGTGSVKDLVAAEQQVGVWREKVEKVTGEINYYNNLVSLSTLRITLTERDLRQAALASEQETVRMGIETDDVEKARADAMRTLDAAKGRIIQSELKQLDAGQLAATITAEVSPDAAGPVVDHFKQLGRVARLNIDRQQTVADGATVPPGVKVQRLDTRLQISLYNLANVSPRQTTNVSMACPDVETAYHAIISKVVEAGGRVVDSSLNRVRPEQTDGTISFEAPLAKADAVLAEVRMLGEVMHLAVAENPDAANVTNAKEGFVVTLASVATIAPRQTIASTLMPAGSVADAYHAVLSVVQQDRGNVTGEQLQEQNSQSDSASLVFDVGREHQGEIEKAIAGAIGPTGRVISRQISRSNDTEHTLDSKVQYNLTFASADALQPREVTTRVLAVADVSGTYSRILAAAQQAGAKVAAAMLDQANPSNPSGQLDLIVGRTELGSVEKAIAEAKGGTISKSVGRSADLNSTTDEKVELRLTMTDLNQLPPRQTTSMNVEVSDPETESSDLQAAALGTGGRIVEQHLVKDDKYQAHLVVQVPLAKAADFIDQVRNAGTVRTIERTEDQSVPETDFAEAKLDITLNATSAIVGPGAGLWAGLKGGLSASVRGLAYSLELVIIGGCLALPWAALAWLGWKAARRFRRKPVSPMTGPA